ncbi:ferric reductase-like transmembrane domain-containing protein [Occallatibacter riparius]|uniref:Ferric reductase-like transmembrane domain-containing protein n=1 Tax=Occallatibacter riparius TaxID=1002689 RepID=A0A9J7BYZ7_9BACT|nr:ferric reductase-like transmembrane domain-containing protein [Occallatibacter riparius]UWZ86718.1 ferric reductase-like transmembrane domain-containing protein [Occallatibacter riparius]
MKNTGPIASPRKSRLQKRLLRHHLPLFLLSCASASALYFTRPYPDVLTRLSFSTAYPAMALLAITLLTGPWNILRRRTNPVSSDLRRDIGIWAGILGVIHTAVGQCVHLRGKPWLYYVYGPQEHHHGLRHDVFGFSNYAGALSVLLLAALLAMSNDWSLRRLGTRQWKSLQRWNYAVFALAAAHAIGYLVIEQQKLPFDTVIAICIAITLVMQALGFSKRFASKRAVSGPLMDGALRQPRP